MSIDSVAREFRVGNVVEGSVMRFGGDTIRVIVELTDAVTGEQLGSRRLEREWESNLTVLDDLAHELSRFLRRELGVEIRRHEEAMRWTRQERKQFPEAVEFSAVELLNLTFVADGPEEADRAWELYGEVETKSPPKRLDLFLPRAKTEVAAVLARAGLPDSAKTVIQHTVSNLSADTLRRPGRLHIRPPAGYGDAAASAVSAAAAANPASSARK